MSVFGALITAGLAQLLARCAPNVGPRTMSAVVMYESGAQPFAIGDNTARRSYFPADRMRGEALAHRLLRAGHSIDVGYAQINSANFAAYGLDERQALDPCTNVATGSRILERAYAQAVRHYGKSEATLRRALTAYNSGAYFAASTYASAVYATAATLRYERTGTHGSARDVRGVRAVRFLIAPRTTATKTR